WQHPSFDCGYRLALQLRPWRAAPLAFQQTGAVMANIIGQHRIVLLTGCALLALPLFITPAAAGCNSGNVANTALLSSSSCEADGSGTQATAVGSGADASGSRSTALGQGAFAQGASDTAIGVGSGAAGTGGHNTSVGDSAGNLLNAGSGNTAIGASTFGVSGLSNSVMVGAFAKASANG